MSGGQRGQLPAVVVAEPVRLDFLWRPILNDTDDDMVLETVSVANLFGMGRLEERS